MYPVELEIKGTTESNTSASYLDLLLSIGRDGQLYTSIYDKRDHFNFHITNFQFPSSNIPASPAYGVFISQLIDLHRLWVVSMEHLQRVWQGTLTLPDTWFRPPLWDLLVLQLLRPDSSNLPCLYSTFHLEYPLVLARFCLCDMPRACSRLNVLFWGRHDFQISFSNRDTSWNTWNRYWRSRMVDTGILFNKTKFLSHEC